jgi:sporulation protein YlmC with PRC-barrel domain
VKGRVDSSQEEEEGTVARAQRKGADARGTGDDSDGSLLNRLVIFDGPLVREDVALIGVEKQILGCLVRDIQTGSSIGWVKSIVFDPAGELITELLVDPTVKPRGGMGADPGEKLIGQPLFDPAGRYMGEIIDIVVGAESGRLQGLMVERGAGEQGLVPAYQGLMWEGDHWSLLEDATRLRSTMFTETVEAVEPEDPASDWMVGRRATVRLTDRRGQVIAESGQRITPGMVEQASRAGVLHRLEVDF